ncbi:hypothetical protein ABIE91_007154 [Bradyrhizobium elkanii]
MGVSRRRRCPWRELIPTRFALTSKATSPFQGEVRAQPDFAEPVIGRAFARPVGSIRATQYRSALVPISAPTLATIAVASVYQVATNSGESSVQCDA